MKKIIFFCSALFVLWCMNSCSNDNVLTNVDDEVNSTSKIDDDALKRKFGVALSKLFDSSIMSREIVKNEALKKINQDYDVLYLLINNELVENDVTFEKALTQFINADTLKLIEQLYPTLTIFVPTLPEGYFSAEDWDINNDSPAIAVVSSKTNGKVKVLVPTEDEHEEFILENNQIPAFPVVVLKENERIVASSSTTLKSASLNTIGNSQFSFISDVFDNYNSENKTKASRPSKRPPESNVDPKAKYKKLFEAYDEFGIADKWQRDNVYYNLTNKNTVGKINTTYMEHLVGFEMLGDGMTAYRKISDQSEDPKVNETQRSGRYGATPAWADGDYEFKVSVFLGSKSPVGSVSETYFYMKPEKIFRAVHKGVVQGGAVNITVLYFDRVELVRYYLPEPLPLFDWDIEKYSAVVKISIEEVDISTTITATSTNTLEFANNFEFNIGWGDKVKKGLKYGASAKTTATNTFTEVRNVGSDILGDVIINFSDPVILNKENAAPKSVANDFQPNYNTKYKTGWYRILVAPLNTYE